MSSRISALVVGEIVVLGVGWVVSWREEGMSVFSRPDFRRVMFPGLRRNKSSSRPRVSGWPEDCVEWLRTYWPLWNIVMRIRRAMVVDWAEGGVRWETSARLGLKGGG